MSKILIAGLDGAMANFGIARLWLDLQTNELSVDNLILIETEKTKVKQVRASSDNLSRAQQIYGGMMLGTTGASVAFAEVPTGGQSAKAVLAFGMVIGLYASLPIPLIEVAPAETKLATVGTRTASKQEMIDWAFDAYPKAPWKTTKRGGVLVPTAKNEHLADACAVCHAGIRTPAFQQVRAILAANVRALAA
jgi:hypothetical protein